MMKKLLYLKGYPEQIKPTLQAFEKYQDEPFPKKRQLIKAYLYPKLLELRKNRRGVRRKEATSESLISNQAIPACYTLSLLVKEGRPKQTRLTPEAWILLKALQQEGEEAYLKKLGRILIDFDERNNKVIETIESIRNEPGDFVSMVSLAVALHKRGIDASERMTRLSPKEIRPLKASGIQYLKGSRLSDLLKYYQFSNIIIRKEDQIYLNSPRIRDIKREAILQSPDDITNKRFFEELYAAYKSKTQGERSRPYVPLWPYIRDRVCKELEISLKDFSKMLNSLPTVVEGRQIHLAHAGKGRPRYQLTEFGKEFYYYIAIFESDKNNV